MWYNTKATEILGIQYPILQGPFGGNLSSVELIATVSNAGGMGGYGAYTLSPQEIVDVGAGAVVQGSDKVEIFFRSKIADQEAFVEVGCGVDLPVFGSGDILIARNDFACIGADKVKDEAEKCGLAGAVIAHQADYLTLPGCKLGDIDDGVAIVSFLYIINGDHTM